MTQPFSLFQYQVNKSNLVLDCIQINYLAQVQGKKQVILSSEHQDFAWITDQEVDQYLTSKQVKHVLIQAFKAKK